MPDLEHPLIRVQKFIAIEQKVDESIVEKGTFEVIGSQCILNLGNTEAGDRHASGVLNIYGSGVQCTSIVTGTDDPVALSLPVKDGQLVIMEEVEEMCEAVKSAYGGDFAELYRKFDPTEIIRPGDIVRWKVEGDISGVTLAHKKYDPAIIGIVSDRYAYLAKGDASNEPKDFDHTKSNKYVPVGIGGRLFVTVSGNIKVGDLITSMTTKSRSKYGVGCKASRWWLNHAIVGKALSSHRGRDLGRVEIQLILK